MSAERDELIKYRLERARMTLREAKSLMDIESWAGCTNRLYYACFYAASAVLESRGLKSKKHSGVLSLFNKHAVKTGFVPKETASVYNLMFDKRQVSDYADLIRLERADVEHLVPGVEEFVQCMHEVLGIPVDE